MIKKYIALILCLLLLAFILVFGINVIFNSDEEKKVNVSVDGNNYSLPLGSTYKDLKDKVGEDISDNFNENAILKDNQQIESTENSLDKVSINTASKEELMTLPGIGEKTAIKIIEYRENYGLFWSIEDIKNVSGIGDKKFEKLKDLISV